MPLRIAFATLAVVCFFASLTAQTNEDLERRFTTFAEAQRTGNTESLLGCLDARLFDFVPRAVVSERLTSLRSDANMRVIYADYNLVGVGTAIVEDGVRYAPVDYANRITFVMESAAFQEPTTFHRVVRMLQKQYGEDRVSVDVAEATAHVDARGRLFAIDRGRGWYFVEAPEEGASVVDLLVPPEVMNRLAAQ